MNTRNPKKRKGRPTKVEVLSKKLEDYQARIEDLETSLQKSRVHEKNLEKQLQEFADMIPQEGALSEKQEAFVRLSYMFFCK